MGYVRFGAMASISFPEWSGGLTFAEILFCSPGLVLSLEAGLRTCGAMAPMSTLEKRPLLTPSDANLQGHDANEDGIVTQRPAKRVRLVSLDAVRGACVVSGHGACAQLG